MKRILLAGGTGQVGQAIVKEANSKGIDCHVLTRNITESDSDVVRYFSWNPSEGKIDIACLNDVDVLINLAGMSIDVQWSEENKEKLIKSRVESTKCLGEAMKSNSNIIKTVINASAIGLYFPSFDLLHEDSPRSASFLGRMAQAWERSTEFYPTTAHVVCVRIGLVLGASSKIFEKIKPTAKWGIGVVLGTSDQYVSWIHEVDLARAILHLGNKKNPEREYNTVSPNPVKAPLFFKSIHRVFAEPKLMLKVPEALIRFVFKEKSELLLSSHNVSSALLAQDFEFEYPTIESAVEEISKHVDKVE
jgi:uncharacterized protein